MTAFWRNEHERDRKITSRDCKEVSMKKKNRKQRKLRKCERGVKTKSHNHGCKYNMTSKGLMPFL